MADAAGVKRVISTDEVSYYGIVNKCQTFFCM